MALGDINIVGRGGQNLPAAVQYRVAAAATTINAGEPAFISGNYVIPLADASPTTTLKITGVASSTSNQTASVDGVVDLIPCLPGVVWSCKAKNTALIDTDAELLALLNNIVVLDLTAGVYTVDTAAGSSATNGIMIVGGDITSGQVFFEVQQSTTTN